jgi:hypothetical protein
MRTLGGRLRSLLVIVLAGALIAGIGGCGGGGSTPEDAVRGAFKALEAKNAEKLVSYYVEDARDQVLADQAYAFSIVDRFKVSNLKTTVVGAVTDQATVEADYDLSILAGGQTTKQHINELYQLSQVDGKWLLMGEATEIETVTATPTPTATPAAFSSPEGTVLEYYRAIESRDIGAIQRCFINDLRDDIQPALEEYFSYADSVSIPSIQVELLQKSDTEATVRANYEIYIVDSGETQGGPVEEDIYLQKTGGKWLIAEDMGLGS